MYQKWSGTIEIYQKWSKVIKMYQNWSQADQNINILISRGLVDLKSAQSWYKHILIPALQSTRPLQQDF